MATIKQLSFQFNYPVAPTKGPDNRTTWQIRAIARRYGVPLSQAIFIADAMGLPEGEMF